ncbi:PP2C family protein-serine/threonine phosphatase [Streptomyces badius]
MITAKRRGDPAVLSWLPIVVMAVVAAMDLTAGPQAGFLPLVSLGPAFAGLIGTWRRTVLIGCAALLLCAGLGVYDGLFDTRRGYTAMASVAGVTLAGALAASTRMRREAELASVRSIAEVAQRVLQRPVPRRVGSLQVAASYASAVAESRIGGDLYEVVVSPYGVRVIVGDVQGKGLAAVETAALVLGVFREAAHDEPGLTAIAARLERTVARDAGGEKFVTAVLAEIHTEENSVAFLNCGHPAPMIIRADRSVDFPPPPAYALPIGMGTLGGDPPRPYRADFSPGEQLLLYTDGVTEARDAEGAFYPLEERAGLLDISDADAALEALRTDIVRYARGPQDDAAMLLLRYRRG